MIGTQEFDGGNNFDAFKNANHRMEACYMDQPTISILVDVPEEGSDTKSVYLEESRTTRMLLPIERLREEMRSETSKLIDVLNAAPADPAGWHLKEVEVGVEITAEGGLSFIGTAKAGAHASFKIKFQKAAK
jgi:hypothetical protein